jgi:hypothetical protein
MLWFLIKKFLIIVYYIHPCLSSLEVRRMSLIRGSSLQSLDNKAGFCRKKAVFTPLKKCEGKKNKDNNALCFPGFGSITI